MDKLRPRNLRGRVLRRIYLLFNYTRLFGVVKQAFVFLDFVADAVAFAFRAAYVGQFEQNARVTIVKIVCHFANELGILLGYFYKFNPNGVNIFALLNPGQAGAYFYFTRAGQLQANGKFIGQRCAQP